MKESPEKDFSQNILPSNVPISNPLQLRGRESDKYPHSRFSHCYTDLLSLVPKKKKKIHSCMRKCFSLCLQEFCHKPENSYNLPTDASQTLHFRTLQSTTRAKETGNLADA